jgi:hypothetical protein
MASTDFSTSIIGLVVLLMVNAFTESHDASKESEGFNITDDIGVVEAEKRLIVLRELLADRMSLVVRTRFELRNPGRDYDASCSLFDEGECLASMYESKVWLVYWFQYILRITFVLSNMSILK